MPARARWKAPSQPSSSPAVITRTTPLVPANSLAMFPIAATKAATPHFMSLEPRPYILPSMISPANASTLQEAFPSGTVSTWPVKHSGSLLPTAPTLAIRLARPGANSWSEVSSPAPERILSKCNMQLSSLPGGLIVLKDMSSRESSIGSIRMLTSPAPVCPSIVSINPSAHHHFRFLYGSRCLFRDRQTTAPVAKKRLMGTNEDGTQARLKAGSPPKVRSGWAPAGDRITSAERQVPSSCRIDSSNAGFEGWFTRALHACNGKFLEIRFDGRFSDSV